MVKVVYDKETNILAFRLSSKKSVDSDVQDNVVIDRDKDDNVVNIEIMDVSMNEFRKAKSRMGTIAGLSPLEAR